MAIANLAIEFVEFIPEVIRGGRLYISTTHAIVVHLCACGCETEVVTPLSPTDWALTFDGETISLEPSIGNWDFMCRSHYWILKNRIVWSPTWSHEEVKAARRTARRAKDRFYRNESDPPDRSFSAKDQLWIRLLRKLWRAEW